MSSNNDKSRRLALLERAYLQDRERWRASDERIEGLLREVAQQGARLDAMMRVLSRHDQEIRRLGEQNDATLRILRRMLEK